MARIRSIKPEFWSDEKLSECSLSARLLFIGLISHVDDEGRMEFSPTRIRMQVFPCGKANQKQVIEWLEELNERSLIRGYMHESKQYLDIPGFSKHQKINRPTPSKLPKLLTESSLSALAGKERKGMERKGSIPLTPFDPKTLPGLDLKAWGDWVSYREKRRPPINPESRQKAAEQMAALGPQQRAAVDHSIANGYQGLVEPKIVNGSGARKPAVKIKSIEELEAEEEARVQH